MDYSKLVAVTGMPGLYELINTKSDGAIVRSLEDNSTKFASSRIHSFSQLESIEVYTIRDNVNLVEVFQAMEKAGGSLPDGKDSASLKKYFEKAYPDLDFERVYASDLKKMVKWFDILKKLKIELKLSEPEPAIEEEVVVEEPKEKAEKKSVKKEAAEEKAPKKPTAKKEEPKKEPEEKPAKKKAAVKKETTSRKADPAKAEEKPKKKAAPKKK